MMAMSCCLNNNLSTVVGAERMQQTLSRVVGRASAVIMGNCNCNILVRSLGHPLVILNPKPFFLALAPLYLAQARPDVGSYNLFPVPVYCYVI